MLHKIFIFLALFIVIPDIYIYKMFITRLDTSTIIRWCYFIPSLLLLIGLVYLAFVAKDTIMTEKSRLVGWFIFAYMLFMLPKLFFFASSIFDLPIKYIFKWHIMPFSYLGILLAVIWVGILIYGATWGKTKFDIRNVSYTSPHIPAGFQGYKIVQISDIHIGSWEGNEEALTKAVKLINEQHADLIVFTGDLVNHRADELTGFEKILSSIKARDGIYSILGNHDYGPYYHWESPRAQAENLVSLKQKEAEMGWKLLNNEHTILHCDNDSIALIGVENEGEPPFSQHGDLNKALDGVNTSFKLLLSHNPSHWKREVLPQTDIDLMLAGHTHGMQLAFGQHSLSSLIYPQWRGMYKEGNRSLYVNVGLGFIGMPFRYGAWPEITVITLNRPQ